jgi:hypothetical protein
MHMVKYTQWDKFSEISLVYTSNSNHIFLHNTSLYKI